MDMEPAGGVPSRVTLHSHGHIALVYIDCLSPTSSEQAQQRFAQPVLEEHDEHDAVLTVAGYTMGAMWPPTWMEEPMIFEGNPLVLEENMTFFTHMILNDRETGLSMAVGETAIITTDAPEIITHTPREPIIKQ